MNDMILILNYSDEFAVEAAKRLRGERVFCKIISGTTTAAQVAEIAPRGLVLCGEPKSAAGVFDAEILKLDIPVLALGHAAHMLIAAMGGACAGAAISEKKANVQYADCKLFNGVEGGERYIQEAVTLMLPADVQVTASAGGCTVAFEDSKRSLFGVQFELERNDPDGSTILKNFARDICGCTPWFTMDAALAEARRALTEASIEGGFAVCGVSGGVDSMVAAVLAHQAFGERMTAIYVETGLMRAGDGAAVRAIYEQLGIPLRVIDRAEDVLATLRGRQTMGEKRAMVVSCLHEEMIRQTEAIPGAKTLVMGTNYSDFLGGTNNAAWKDCGMAVLEPLALLPRRGERNRRDAGAGRRAPAAQALPADGIGRADSGRGDAAEAFRAAHGRRDFQRGNPRGRPAQEALQILPGAGGRGRTEGKLHDYPARGDGLRRDARSGEAALRSGGAHRGTHFGDDARRSARVLRPDADAGWKREISINHRNEQI